MAQKQELMMYVLHPKTRQRVGVVVAVPINNDIQFGWSQCMVKPTRKQRDKGITEPDVFDKIVGLNKARGRSKAHVNVVTLRDALAGTPGYHQMALRVKGVPHLCRMALRRLGKMAKKYYKK